MFPDTCKVVKASSLEEATELLRAYPGAEILAGGQSLIPLMKTRLASPDVVVDISHLAPDEPIEFDTDTVGLHALTTHAELGAHDRLTATFDIVEDTVPQIADAQVRNMGTIGGSLAEADPGNDWGPVVMAVGGVVHTRSPDGSRAIPADEFVLGPFTTALEEPEIIESISLPRPDERTGSTYIKAKRRQGGYGVASVAVQLRLDDRDECEAITVAVADGTSAYVRPHAAEELLTDSGLEDGLIDRASNEIAEAVDPISDTTGSVEYKRNLCGALFEHAVSVAGQRAAGHRTAIDPIVQKGVVT